MFVRTLPRSMSHGAIMYALAFALIMAVSFLAGCSGATDPTQKQPLKPAMNIIGGDAQSDTVTRQLPSPLAVQVVQTVSGELRLNMTGNGLHPRFTGTPMANIIVNFQVQEAGCGKPFAGSQITDTNGNAKELWILGQKAGNCTMKAVAVDRTTGAPLTFDTFQASALPDTVVAFRFDAAGYTLKVGDTLWLANHLIQIRDQYNNTYASVPAFTWSFNFRSTPAERNTTPYAIMPDTATPTIYVWIGSVSAGAYLNPSK